MFCFDCGLFLLALPYHLLVSVTAKVGVFFLSRGILKMYVIALVPCKERACWVWVLCGLCCLHDGKNFGLQVLGNVREGLSSSPPS